MSHGPLPLEPPDQDVTGTLVGARTLPAAPVDEADHRLARTLAKVGLGLVLAATAAITVVHLLPAGRALDPLARTISEYALTPVGRLFDAGVLLLSAGSLATLGALTVSRLIRWNSWAGVLVTIWCAGLVGLILFPKKALGSQIDVGSRVHWTWTLIAFFSLPIGALRCCRAQARAGERWPGWVVRLSMVAAGWFGVLTVQTVLSAATRIPAWRWVGFVERALSLTEMAAVVALGLWVLAQPPPPVSTEPAPPTPERYGFAP